MVLNKKKIIVLLVSALLVYSAGFFTGKAVYDRPVEAKVERDTVVVTDTVKHYLPTPKDSIRTRYITRYLPVHDTIDHFVEISNMVHDTVAVEVPITSKHYGTDEYDAWVSGYEPSLDSIYIYNETQYITETVTLSKPPNKFSIGLQGGYGYGFKSKTWEPYVGVGLSIRIF